MRLIYRICFILSCWLILSTSYANTCAQPQVYYNGQQCWESWLQDLRHEALAQGIKADVFDRAFADVKPQAILVNRDQKQVTAVPNYYQYLKLRGDANRIRLGREQYQQHKALLEKIGQQYQVNPCYIVAIWGIETIYGHFTGNHSVIDSLATLAYDTRRSNYFRQELLYALQIINDGYMAPDNFKGAWDGGMGQPQFMPSSWYKYAVDYTGNGRKDIWHSYGDTFASIANYLRSFGWQNNQPYSVEVTVPPHIDAKLLRGDVTKTVKAWRALGVKIKKGQAAPNAMLPASLIQLDGGPAILMFNNFKTMLHYNRSKFYAGTVNYLAKHICRKA